MSKKIIILILSSFLFTGCATVSEKANNAYDFVAGGVFQKVITPLKMQLLAAIKNKHI